jgi:CheY-like chemotaxis protein
VKLLYIEADRSEVNRFSQTLRDKGYGVENAHSVLDGIMMMSMNHYDFVCIDTRLRRFDGREAGEFAREHRIPFMYYSAENAVPLSDTVIVNNRLPCIMAAQGDHAPVVSRGPRTSSQLPEIIDACLRYWDGVWENVPAHASA